MTPPLPIGAVLAGKYRIERVLGEGGMGIVVAATHLQLEQLVAIKFLLAEALQNPEIVARFAREARTLAKLKSENVGRVIDVGVTDAGAPYMVMEYLEGRDLESELQARGSIPVDETIDYVLQACEAIAEAHAAGIVHRDLKPANLFLVRRQHSVMGMPSVKVLDFGISKSESKDRRDAGLTKTAALMGSPLYMSPEQLERASEIDARSDIWALGVILFELVSGKLPFDGETIAQLVTSVLHAKTPSLREVRPDVPEELDAVVLRCLEKHRDNRFSDVAELAYALLPFASPRGERSIERIDEALHKPPSSVMAVAAQSSSRPALPLVSPATPRALAATPSSFSADGKGAAPATDTLSSAKRPARRAKGVLVIGALCVASFAACGLVFARSHAKDAPGAARDRDPATSPSGVVAAGSNGQMSTSVSSAEPSVTGSPAPSSSSSSLPVASVASVASAAPARPDPVVASPPAVVLTRPAAGRAHPAASTTPAIKPSASPEPMPSSQPWHVELK